MREFHQIIKKKLIFIPQGKNRLNALKITRRSQTQTDHMRSSAFRTAIGWTILGLSPDSALRPIQTPIKQVPGSLSQGILAEVKNEWRYTSTSPSVSTACKGTTLPFFTSKHSVRQSQHYYQLAYTRISGTITTQPNEKVTISDIFHTKN